MEGNHDEANRAADMARECLAKGDRAKAIKLLRKSVRMYPNAEVQVLLERVLANTSSTSSSSGSTSRTAPQPSAPPHPSSTNTGPSASNTSTSVAGGDLVSNLTQSYHRVRSLIETQMGRVADRLQILPEYRQTLGWMVVTIVFLIIYRQLIGRPGDLLFGPLPKHPHTSKLVDVLAPVHSANTARNTQTILGQRRPYHAERQQQSGHNEGYYGGVGFDWQSSIYFSIMLTIIMNLLANGVGRAHRV